jgi:hypothetical protein
MFLYGFFVPFRIFVLLMLIHIAFPFNIYYVHNTYFLAASTYRNAQKLCPCFRTPSASQVVSICPLFKIVAGSIAGGDIRIFY